MKASSLVMMIVIGTCLFFVVGVLIVLDGGLSALDLPLFVALIVLVLWMLKVVVSCPLSVNVLDEHNIIIKTLLGNKKVRASKMDIVDVNAFLIGRTYGVGIDTKNIKVGTFRTVRGDNVWACCVGTKGVLIETNNGKKILVGLGEVRGTISLRGHVYDKD
ncbi:hypothetical protein [Pyrococcus woesei]|uniref:hypothetical protein n=1 Tax=Pyrococcus woesei TaxID=2262 RepID=UPI003D2F2D04